MNVNCSNGVLTLSTGQFLTLPGGSDTDLREGMLAFSSGGEIGAYTKVIDVTQTTCTLSPALAISLEEQFTFIKVED